VPFHGQGELTVRTCKGNPKRTEWFKSRPRIGPRVRPQCLVWVFATRAVHGTSRRVMRFPSVSLWTTPTTRIDNPCANVTGCVGVASICAAMPHSADLRREIIRIANVFDPLGTRRPLFRTRRRRRGRTSIAAKARTSFVHGSHDREASARVPSACDPSKEAGVRRADLRPCIGSRGHECIGCREFVAVTDLLFDSGHDFVLKFTVAHLGDARRESLSLRQISLSLDLAHRAVFRPAPCSRSGGFRRPIANTPQWVTRMVGLIMSAPRQNPATVECVG
jgi:hypothetical protein